MDGERDPGWGDCHRLAFWAAVLFAERSLLNTSNMILRRLLFTVQAAIAKRD